VTRRLGLLLLVSTVASVALACSGGEEASSATTPEGERIHGLTAEERAATLAKIGDREISVGEFGEIVASKGPFLSVRYNSPERRRELLDQLVRFELLAHEADERGYDELPEVRRARKQIVIRRFLKREYEDRFAPDDVSDADVAAYYASHEGEFNKPAQVRISQILFTNEATARRVLRQLLASPTDVRLFRALAEEHNTDPATRDRFGDVGFVSAPAERQPGEPEVPAEVATAAFAIESIGGVAPELVHSAAGWHIVKLTGRRAPLHRSLEEATRPIRHRLFRERREAAIEELITRLHAAADVHEDLSVLDSIHIDLPPEGVTPTGGIPVDAVPGSTPDDIHGDAARDAVGEPL
jgi:peptidyl-prolyl cis-trans isomerase C